MLRDRGWAVVPTARHAEDLDRLRAEGFDPLGLDLADHESVFTAADAFLERCGGRPGALVNNAGFGLAAAIEDSSRQMFRDVFEVNLFGLQELTNRLIPSFRRQGYGRIVNVSSVLGEISLPFAGIYSASKHALEAVSDALRRELAGSGVAVSVLQPGPIETRFSQNLAVRSEGYAHPPGSRFEALYREAIATRKAGTASRTAGRFEKPPEAVARQVARCIESRRPPRRVRITMVAGIGAAARRALPAAVLDAVMGPCLKRLTDEKK